MGNKISRPALPSCSVRGKGQLRESRHSACRDTMSPWGDSAWLHSPWGNGDLGREGAGALGSTACTPRNSAEVDQGPCGCSAVPLPPGSLQEPPPEPCQRGVSSQPPGSCSSSSLSGLLCSNREQTPFMRPRRCFLPGLGPEEGDVTTMQTDDGSRHLGRGRAADPRQGAQPRVCEGVLAAGGPPAGSSLALGEELWSTPLV